MKRIISTMGSKEISKHVVGIKINKENRYDIKFIIGGETHSVEALTKFCISVCYLGAVYSAHTGTGKVRLPVKMVWELADFASTLQYEEKVLTQSHNEILRYAEKLLTDGGIFESCDKRRKFSVTFDLCGKDIGDFKAQMRLSIFWSFAF